MQNFRNLKVWQKAHELALLVYQLTADFPREETFGLRHSLRKMAVDIPGLIAEGAGKATDHEFALCVSSANGLSNRLEYSALIAADLDLLQRHDYDHLIEVIIEVRKMLSGFSQKLA